MRKVIHAATGVLACCAALLLGFLFYMNSSLPDKYMVSEGGIFSIPAKAEITATVEQAKSSRQVLTQSGNIYQAQLKLFGVVPLKQVTVEVVEKELILPQDSFRGWYINNGKLETIIDSDLAMIFGDKLDGISETADNLIGSLNNIIYG